MLQSKLTVLAILPSGPASTAQKSLQLLQHHVDVPATCAFYWSDNGKASCGPAKQQFCHFLTWQVLAWPWTACSVLFESFLVVMTRQILTASDYRWNLRGLRRQIGLTRWHVHTQTLNINGYDDIVSCLFALVECCALQLVHYLVIC